MSKEDLRSLHSLLLRFKSFVDAQDAETIQRAMNIYRAAALTQHHEQNFEKIDAVIAMVSSQITKSI